MRMETPNKRNKWKNVIIVLMCSGILLVSALVVFTDEFKDGIHNFFWYESLNTTAYNGVGQTEVALEAVEETVDELAVDDGFFYADGEMADAVSSCEDIFFYGDTGYLVKGALYDATASAAYYKLPDTVALLHYGDQLGQATSVSETAVGTFIYGLPMQHYGENHPATLYRKLAEQKKVEFLKLLPNRRGKLEVADKCDFDYQYSKYFDPKISAQRNTPLPIKKALIDYFDSSEGDDYQFVADRRKEEQVYRLDNFTGINPFTQKPTRSLATVLTEKDSDGSFRERILVVGYDAGSEEGEILYNEAFYDTKLLINVYDRPISLPEEAWSLARFITPSKKLIQVKTDEGSSIYLYYDDDFDTMVRKVFSEYE